MANEGIQFIKNEIHFNNTLTSKKYLVVNFTASWCGPCHATKSAVDSLYDEPKYSKIEFVRVDIDVCQAVARKYNITSVPAFLFFSNKKEVNRVNGFTPDFRKALDELKDQADGDLIVHSRHEQETIDEPGSSSAYKKEISKFIPKGFEVINDAIHFGEMVALNAMPLNKKIPDAKSTFKPLVPDASLFTDADSQGLFFVPLNHICKVYSILIKTIKPVASDSIHLDSEEVDDECQNPSLIKVWANKPSVLSFEDCAAPDALHEEKFDPYLEDGWHEIKLRYVRFQNVQNLNIFIDGEDEDKHTIIEKVILVGLTGDSNQHVGISQDDE